MMKYIETGYPIITPSIQVLCGELIARAPLTEGKADTGLFFVGSAGWRIFASARPDGGLEMYGGPYFDSGTAGERLAGKSFRLLVDCNGRVMEAGSAFSPRINGPVEVNPYHVQQFKIAMTAFIAHDVENPLKEFKFLDQCRRYKIP